MKNQITEPIGLLPQPANRPAPQAQPGTGVLKAQEVVVGGGKPFDANKVTVPFTQRRIVKAELPTIKELQDQMLQVAADVHEVQDWYRNLSLDEFWRPVNECRARIAELEAQLTAERAKLEKLNPDRHPKQIYVEGVQKAEQATSEFARLLISKFSDLAAHKQFGVSYEKLTAANKQDIRLRFEEIYRRIGLPGWVRLYRNERLSDEQVGDTVSRILEAIAYFARTERRHLTNMKSFEQIYNEAWERKFGKPSAQPEPAPSGKPCKGSWESRSGHAACN